jgi:hypothetical protein
MDKNYKSLFVAEVKARMKRRFPEFISASVPAEHRDRQIFAGTLLYRRELRSDAYVWLTWEPGPGVERCFHVRLGWSRSAERLPCLREHDGRIYSLRGPDAMFDAASLDLEQIEGKAAVGGITIPSPWDQLLAVKAAAPKKELDAAIQKADAEASMLTKEERADAVALTVIGVINRLVAVLPAFESALLESTAVT